MSHKCDPPPHNPLSRMQTWSCRQWFYLCGCISIEARSSITHRRLWHFLIFPRLPVNLDEQWDLCTAVGLPFPHRRWRQLSHEAENGEGKCFFVCRGSAAACVHCHNKILSDMNWPLWHPPPGHKHDQVINMKSLGQQVNQVRAINTWTGIKLIIDR